MTLFSNYLEEILKNNNISIKQFASECSLSITDAKAFVHGTALPDNIEVIQHIYNTLHFSLHEKQQITEHYIEATEGTDIMKSFKIMEEIVNKIVFSQDRRNFFLPHLSYQNVPEAKEEYLTLNSTKEIHEAIKHALEFALSKGRAKIYAYMRPEYFFYSMLQRYSNNSQNDPNITLHQIFCLNSMHSDDNIQNLQSINELANIFFSDLDEDISFYHDNIKYHINKMTILPFMINIGDITIYLNKDSNLGYFVKDAEYGQFMRTMFMKIKEKTKPFTNNTTQQTISKKLSESNNLFSLSDLPVIYCSNGNNISIRPGNYILEKNQIIQLLNDGILERTYYNKAVVVDENARYQLLKQLLCNAKNKFINLFFTKESYPITNNSGIITTDSDIFIVRRNEDNAKIWHFEDSGICRLFKQYFRYRIDTKRTYSTAESIEWLENLLRNHNNG